VATLFWASLRAAYALKRSGRAKIVPWGLAALLLAPAGVSVAIAALAPGAPNPYTYDNFLWDTQVLLAIFVAAQAPELVSSDQRNRVLSLYFSHALERSDYALAKLGALAAAVFGLALAPMLVLFFGRVLLATDVAEAFGNELENLPQVVLAPVLYAVPLAGLSLAIAAYTPRRAYATGGIIALFIVTAAVSAILGEAITSGPIGDLAQLINPFVPIDGTRDLLVGGPAPDSPVSDTGFPLYWFAIEWVAITLVTAGVVVWRYRRVTA
jgi:ABC-2 type transport system permease protein